MPPRWSVVIPAWNEAADLPLTLVSLARHLPRLSGGAEVVVVDNNSTDHTAAIARAAGARVVYEPVNNIARARNAGARVARGDILFFLDADCRVGPALLGCLAAEMAEPHRVAGSAAQIPDRRIHPLDGVPLKIFNAVAACRSLFSGHCLVIRRQVWDALDGFPEWLYAFEAAAFAEEVRHWCRRHGGTTFFLRHPPLPFNCRKLTAMTWRRRIGMVLVLLAGPLAIRRRRWCWFWYDRPGPVPS